MPDSYPGLPAGFEPAPVRKKPVPPGKPVGAVAHITRDLKRGIIDAATAHGSDGNGAGGLTGYLLWLASAHPKAFAGLLAKLLPLQVNSNVAATVAAVNVVSVPGDRYLSQEDIRKLAEPAVIEHQPAESDAA